MALSKAAQSIEDEQIAYEERMKMRKAKAWMPEPNTTIKATVVGMSMRDGGYGIYPVITYRKNDGEIINVHAFHQVLRSTLADLKTAPGSEQYITYLGKTQKNNPTEEEIKTGKDMYHDYDVENVGQDTVSGVAADFTFDPK
jgi:hypothetical protein